MRIKSIGLLLIIFLIQLNVFAQYLDSFVEDESKLYAHTKQVNQFFRRFNGEENRYGDRLALTDSLYHNSSYRKQFIDILFDKEGPNINPLTKQAFIDSCTYPGKQMFLDFHGGGYFAEVKTVFNYKGEQKDCVIFLKLQEEDVGSKWVIINVVFEPFLKQFINADKLPEKDKKFLHPLSHELDFMNLIKVFTSKAIIEQFAEENYKPDFLTLFIYEFKNSNLKFVTVKDVKFHFFQLNGWYFELSKFNRNSRNSGWLISNLLKITNEDRKVLKSLIFKENN